MNCYYITSIFVFSIAINLAWSTDYHITLTNDGPAILGANITFTAVVTPNTDSEFQYVWQDNAILQQSYMIETTNTTVNWTTTYSSSLYPPGQYEIQVTLNKKWSIFWLHETSVREHFNLTNLLNGDMEITQNTSLVKGQYISSFFPSLFEVKLKNADYDYVMKNATYISTYWFIDCEFWGKTDNFTMIQDFRKPYDTHDIEGLVVVSFDPIPPPTTTTTTTTSTTTTSTTTTTPKPTTTLKPLTTTEKPVSHRDITETTQKLETTSVLPSPTPDTNHHKVKREITKTLTDILPICMNQSVIPIDPHKVYGYFHRKVIIQEPVSNISVSGNNWLQHKDMLSLKVKCKGTPPFKYCLRFRPGIYNVTGNETCRNTISTDSCSFPIVHYFTSAEIHSVIIIISNNIHTNVSRVVVRFYEVTKKSQLSVIVVPVSFSIIAAILIVFGISYYIQNRSRFTVEVADFNFGQQYADLEYKTFMERLRESFNNALNWGALKEDDTPQTPPWPSPDNNKYGTMT